MKPSIGGPGAARRRRPRRLRTRCGSCGDAARERNDLPRREPAHRRPVADLKANSPSSTYTSPVWRCDGWPPPPRRYADGERAPRSAQVASTATCPPRDGCAPQCDRPNNRQVACPCRQIDRGPVHDKSRCCTPRAANLPLRRPTSGLNDVVLARLAQCAPPGRPAHARVPVPRRHRHHRQPARRAARMTEQAMAELVRHLEAHRLRRRGPDPTTGAKLVLPTALGRGGRRGAVSPPPRSSSASPRLGRGAHRGAGADWRRAARRAPALQTGITTGTIIGRRR